jgi:hypothetical protein
VEIEGVGHGSVFRAADRVNQVLLEFLGGTSGSAHPWPVRDGAIPGAPVRGLTS